MNHGKQTSHSSRVLISYFHLSRKLKTLNHVSRNNPFTPLLPFTWANRSVHGLGKWCAKLRTGKFRPGIAFTICTNQFHLLENDREHKFPLGIFRLEKQDYLFSCSVAPGNFPMERPKKSCSFLDRWIDR